MPGIQDDPKSLIEQKYYFGINDPLVGDYRTQEAFNPNVMSIYNAWNRYSIKARGAIARGQTSLYLRQLVNILNI
ncbi:hypothetical protein [Nitrosomonas ureae]|uniref:Uncharacterized protein n=1 Tax=Nitrosomonas ureae TaxID=44577 RepID=A0A1H5WSQ7_9PROT|nr:hypothetical protein [Nitrosomonas ureae]SEG02619.1 hypothetical protein SAMN05216334_1217 [Nitrosomonas ureae]